MATPESTEAREFSNRLVEFQLTSAQKDIVFRALAKAKAEAGTGYGTVALECLAIEYLAVPRRSAVSQAVDAGSKRKPVKFGPYPEQLETIREALDDAKAALGCDDEAAALTEICWAYLDCRAAMARIPQ